MWKSDIIQNPYIQEAVEDLIIPGVNLSAYGSGLTDHDIVAICEDLNSATYYLLDMVEGRQDIETAFDAVEQGTKAHGVDMDDYVDGVIENLEGFLQRPIDFI